MTSKTPNTLADELFPRGIALGPAFCNRDTERERLKANILGGQHSWIMGVRRYGKTSLIRQVALELGRKRKSPKVHTESIDLLVIHNMAALDQVLRDAVGHLTAQFLPKKDRVVGTVGKFFAAFKPELSFSDKGFTIKLMSGETGQKTIQRLLKGLDEVASHYGRKAVLVIDEFQQITHIDTQHTIEGAIRAVAQESKALSFVFSGSEKGLLSMMFEDKRRPLYRLCDKLELDRIGAHEHRDFLARAATLRWNRTISGTAIDAILAMTDRHPYYINILCQALWRHASAPSEDRVRDEWASLLLRERSQAQQSILALATAQRAVLKAIAIEPTAAPTSQGYLGHHEIAGSTMMQALEVLVDKDFVRKTENGVYEIVDPLIKGYLAVG